MEMDKLTKRQPSDTYSSYTYNEINNTRSLSPEKNSRLCRKIINCDIFLVRVVKYILLTNHVLRLT